MTNEKDIKNEILYVDDEYDNLFVFKSVFRRYYEVHTANSAEEGFEILKSHKVKVIISDQRMPIMTGVEFLTNVLEIYPDPFRMILTGFSDLDAIIEAVNKGHIYKYLSKPWNKDELKISIDNAIHAFDLKAENTRLIEELKQANLNLEEKVQERTAQILAQNEEIQKVNEEIFEKNNFLEELNHQKNSVIRIVAHDLKSPLFSIKGVLSHIQDNISVPEHKELIQMSHEVIDECVTLIQNLLDVNAIEDQKSQISIEYFDLIDFVKSIIQRMEDKAAAKGIKIYFEANYMSFAIATDKQYLRRILDNLLSNSIKFTPLDSNVFVDLKIVDHTIQINIKDQGKGFTKDDMTKLFQKFQKLSTRPTANEHSSGLGLSIVKLLVDRLGGTIALVSKAEESANFQVILDNEKMKNYIC